MLKMMHPGARLTGGELVTILIVNLTSSTITEETSHWAYM